MQVHGFLPPEARGAGLPAVIVLQEAFGVNPHIRRFCQRVAGEGYAVFAPELFHRTGSGLEFGYDQFPQIKPIMGELTNARIAEDLRETHRMVVARSEVDPRRVSAWGFCLGGWAAVLAACELPLAAAVSYYGGGLVRPRPGIGFTPLVDRLEAVCCPLLLVFGAQDAGIPAEDVAVLRNRLEALGKRHEVAVYPDAGHGFFCEDRAAYHPESAAASWKRSIAWLAACLG